MTPIRFRFQYRCATFSRLISQMIGYWKPLAIAAFFASSTGPHLRLNELYDRPSYGQCLYLGSRGVITHQGLSGHGCPWVVILNSDHQRKFYE